MRNWNQDYYEGYNRILSTKTTYEELKLPKKVVSKWQILQYQDYLWGIETKEFLWQL